MSELPKYLEELCLVQLSSKEIEAASDAFVKACSEEDDAKEAHKAAMASIKEAKESAYKLMNSKRESRLVRCLADWNFPVSGRVTLTRTDTRETFERKMTTEEIAPVLPIAAKKDEPKPEEPKAEDATAPAEVVIADPPEAPKAQLLIGHDPSVIIDLVADETTTSESQADLSLTGDTQDPLAGKVDCDNCGTEHDHGKLCPWCFEVEEFEDEWMQYSKDCEDDDTAVLRFSWSDKDDEKAHEVIGDHLVVGRDDKISLCGSSVGDNPILEGIPADRCICSDCLRKAQGYMSEFYRGRLQNLWGQSKNPAPCNQEQGGVTHFYLRDDSDIAFCNARPTNADKGSGFLWKNQCPDCVHAGIAMAKETIRIVESRKKPKAPKAKKEKTGGLSSLPLPPGYSDAPELILEDKEFGELSGGMDTAGEVEESH